MSDIKRGWIDAGRKAAWECQASFGTDESVEAVLAAVLPLIANGLRVVAWPSKEGDDYRRGIRYAADLIWKEDADE